MFCKKHQISHGVHNKLEGMAHALEIKRKGGLVNVDVEPFTIIRSRAELSEQVLNKKRDNTLFVRTSIMAGDETIDGWNIQPRRKFPTLLHENEAGLRRKLEYFFKLHDEYDALAKNGQAAGELAYVVLALPDDYYTEYLEIAMKHGEGQFGVIVGTSENKIHTRDERGHFPDILMTCSITYEGRSNYKIDMHDMNPALYLELQKTYRESDLKPGFERMIKNVPELMGEFKTETTRLRMVVYESNPNPVIFDWLNMGETFIGF